MLFVLGALQVCKLMLIGQKLRLMVVAGIYQYNKKMMAYSYKKYVGCHKLQIIIFYKRPLFFFPKS